jgi:hypothetical protein
MLTISPGAVAAADRLNGLANKAFQRRRRAAQALNDFHRKQKNPV